MPGIVALVTAVTWRESLGTFVSQQLSPGPACPRHPCLWIQVVGGVRSGRWGASRPGLLGPAGPPPLGSACRHHPPPGTASLSCCTTRACLPSRWPAARCPQAHLSLGVSPRLSDASGWALLLLLRVRCPLGWSQPFPPGACVTPSRELCWFTCRLGETLPWTWRRSEAGVGALFPAESDWPKP